MDLQSELLNAVIQQNDLITEIEEIEDRIVGKYYDIDGNKNYSQFNKEFVSQFFKIQSSSLVNIKNYYYSTFGIEYEDEKELNRRINRDGKKGKIRRMFLVIDPYHQYDFVNPDKQRINDWKFKNEEHRIVSNNKKLFYNVTKMLDYENSSTMIRLGMINLIEERIIGKWYCLDIMKNLNIDIIKQSDGIVSFNVDGNTVYYSFIHKLWGFEWDNFKVVYKTLIGHCYDHQEIIVKRLQKTTDNEDYAVIDSFSKHLLTVSKEKIDDYNYICNVTRIVTNDELLFKNYITVAPIYRRGYRKTLL